MNSVMFSYKVTLAISLLVLTCHWTSAQTTQRPTPRFEPLKQSDFLKAQAFLKWLINNRTENGTTSFNAGFIRLAFHDCVGGCDGCLNLRNPSNAGLDFYKTPLDLMYREFIFPIMSRADWYALAGYTAVQYAAENTPCTGRVCVPPMNFKWGRKDCVNETLLFRRFPGPDNDPRDTIRRTFRMNLLEITALMGAHTLGKNHALGVTWVKNETTFDNQYYKDMVNPALKWRKGARLGAGVNIWAHGDTGSHIMLTSDFFMGFDVGTSFADCNNNPIMSCAKSSTFHSVKRFAEDNDYWLTQFGAAFSVMLNNGNFGKLRSVVWDTFDETFTGELFPPTVGPANITEEGNTTVAPPVTSTATLLDNQLFQLGADSQNSTSASNNTAAPSSGTTAPFTPGSVSPTHNTGVEDLQTNGTTESPILSTTGTLPTRPTPTGTIVDFSNATVTIDSMGSNTTVSNSSVIRQSEAVTSTSTMGTTTNTMEMAANTTTMVNVKGSNALDTNKLNRQITDGNNNTSVAHKPQDSATLVLTPSLNVIENAEVSTDSRVGYSINRPLISRDRIRELLRERQRLLRVRRRRGRQSHSSSSSE